jgi:hypothetical protein
MNLSSEKFTLKWNDFNQSVTSAFGDLRNDSDFTDVTLACEDGQQVEAHKVILAASSPFFQDILRINKHPHPLIYMRGIKAEDLVAIVDFLYYGEAKVYQDNLDNFLALAEDLKLKGLNTGDNQQPDHVKVDETITKPPTKIILNPEQTSIKSENPANEITVAVANQSVNMDLDKLNATIEGMMDETYRATVCKVCGKEGQRGDIRKHIESNHIEGVSHQCNICGKTSKSRHALVVHKIRYHKK